MASLRSRLGSLCLPLVDVPCHLKLQRGWRGGAPDPLPGGALCLTGVVIQADHRYVVRDQLKEIRDQPLSWSSLQRDERLAVQAVVFGIDVPAVVCPLVSV